MSAGQPLLRRVLLHFFARGNGQVRAMKEVRHFENVVRFAGTFAVTILVPSMLLSYLALTSSRSADLAFDAELQAGAVGLGDQIFTDISSIIREFEDRALDRLGRGASPLDNLAELSPYLRAAFRFDEEGLAAPFDLPSADQHRPTKVWREAFREGQLYESRGAYSAASTSFVEAASSNDDPVLRAEALFSAARVREREGQVEEATAAYKSIMVDYDVLRDRLGFRVGDLARLKLHEMALRKSPDRGVTLLQDFVDDLLSARWVIGQPGEAAIARRALQRLQGRVDPDWLARARTRLKARSDEVYWAARVQDELDLFTGSLQRPPNVFTYSTVPESGSLWASIRIGNDLYAFSLSSQSLIVDLQVAASRASAIGDDLTIQLHSSQSPLPKDVVSIRSLAPWLPYASTVVRLKDPASMQERKSQSRLLRLLIILLSLVLVILGVGFSARLIGREMQTAREKTDFAANVSHELRSPITQIRVKAEALLFELVSDPSEQRAHYAAIVRESERLSRLVDNVLDFAAIERGAKKYHLRPEDLSAVIWIAAESSQTVVEQFDCVLDVDVPSRLPNIWMDREALGQVMTNLISNAAKYGSEGGWVGVCVALDEHWARIRVSDRGIGISTDDQDKLFDQFFRSQDPRVRKQKGTGIGLAIVRYIVDAHRGNITVESKVGEGTTFVVALPLDRPPEEN